MIKEAFLNFGYTLNEYKKIMSSSTIKNLKEQTLLDYFEEVSTVLFNLGYSNKTIIKMSLKYPEIYTLSIEKIVSNIDLMSDLGYSYEEIYKISTKLPEIFGFSDLNIINKIKDLKSLGYNYSEVKKITITLPAIFSYSIDSMKNKISYYITLGFTYEEVIKMTKTQPSLYSFSTDNISSKYTILKSLSFLDEEILYMIKKVPSILCLSEDNLHETLLFYEKLGLHRLFVSNPNYLIQGLKLTKARLKFFEHISVALDSETIHLLFMRQREFVRKYLITNDDVKRMYDENNYDYRLPTKRERKMKKFK